MVKYVLRMGYGRVSGLCGACRQGCVSGLEHDGGACQSGPSVLTAATAAGTSRRCSCGRQSSSGRATGTAAAEHSVLAFSAGAIVLLPPTEAQQQHHSSSSGHCTRATRKLSQMDSSQVQPERLLLWPHRVRAGAVRDVHKTAAGQLSQPQGVVEQDPVCARDPTA